MRYQPENLLVPTDNPELEAHIAQEFRRIAAAFAGVEEILLVTINVEPTKPRDGMIILVDGTDFNPGGGGAGFYGRSDGAWVKLG